MLDTWIRGSSYVATVAFEPFCKATVKVVPAGPTVCLSVFRLQKPFVWEALIRDASVQVLANIELPVPQPMSVHVSGPASCPTRSVQAQTAALDA